MSVTYRRFARFTLTLTAILIVLTALSGTGSRASAQEPVSVFFGFVDGPGAERPERVRALIGETVCGTADVLPLGGGSLGFYLVTVAGATDKAGCGQANATVRFLLLESQIDPGTPADVIGEWRAGENQRLDLTAANAVLGQFVGVLPTGRGLALMRWAGPSGTAIGDAIGTIGRPVRQVFFWDVDAQRFQVFIPNAPRSASTYAIVDADDLVFIDVE